MKIPKFILLAFAFFVFFKSIAQCTGCSDYINTGDINLPLQTYAGQTYCIQNNIDIFGEVNFENVEVAINTDAEIVVYPTGKLNIKGSHFYSCNLMWSGIRVLPGGIVNITGFNGISTLFEDANIGLSFDFNFINFNNLNENKLFIDNTIFNRNRISIELKNIQEETWQDYPIKISNCIFTSRRIYTNVNTFSWPNKEDIATRSALSTNAYPSTPLVMSRPYIDDIIFPDNVPESFLKNISLSGVFYKPDAGITLINVGYYHDDVYDGITIGENTGNSSSSLITLFDNINFGILGDNSNVTTLNCTFQSPYFFPPPSTIGILDLAGIKLGQTYPNSNRLRVFNNTIINSPNNAFFGYGNAIISSCAENYIQNCDIRSNQDHTGNPFSGTKKGISITNYGINNSCTIINNEIYNITDPIEYTYSYSPFYHTSGGISYGTNISSNIISLFPDYLPKHLIPFNPYIYDAITINYSSPPPSNNLLKISCNANTIIDAQNGIKISFAQNKNIEILNNIIVVKEPISTFSSQYGIKIEGGYSSGGLGNKILGNKVQYFGSNQNPTKGISIELNTGNEIACNEINNFNYGYSFSSTNSITKFWDNTINFSNKFGLVLTNQGIIGQQGTNTRTTKCPSDNIWTGDNTNWLNSGNFKAASFSGSDASQSKLIVRPNSTYNPNGLTFFDFNPSVPYNVSSSSIIPIPSPYSNCKRCMGETTGARVVNNDFIEEEIASNSIKIYGNKKNEKLNVMQQELYNYLPNDSFILNNKKLSKFYNVNKNRNLGAINNLLNYVSNSDTLKANKEYIKLDNSNVSYNVKLYYNWLKKYNNNFTNQNRNDIIYLANLCPFTDGTIVYAARNLLEVATKIKSNYNKACDDNFLPSNKMSVEVDSKKEETFNENIIVFPNPTKGFIYLKNLSAFYKKAVTIYDLKGVLLKTVVLPKATTEYSYNYNLPTGNYILKVETNIKTVSKLISIIK